jgi:hypothetical protein
MNTKGKGPGDGELVRELRSQLMQLEAEDRLSGTVLVAKLGQPLFLRAAGYANRAFDAKVDLDTKFFTASMAKPFTLVATLHSAFFRHFVSSSSAHQTRRSDAVKPQLGRVEIRFGFGGAARRHFGQSGMCIDCLQPSASLYIKQRIRENPDGWYARSLYQFCTSHGRPTPMSSHEIGSVDSEIAANTRLSDRRRSAK